MALAAIHICDSGPNAKIHATFIVRPWMAADTRRVPFSVLIVDDNEPWMSAAAALLEREGVSVAGIVSSSEAALRDARQLRPDVVLVDLFLGSENGLELAYQLHHDEDCCSDVILISSHGEDDFAELISASPARGFLPKSQLSAQAIRARLAA